jgi:hypothetical protein
MKNTFTENPNYEDLAKLIDDRGSISIKRVLQHSGQNKSTQHRIEVSVRSVEQDFLLTIKEAFGGTVTVHDKRTNRNVMYEWKAISQKAKEVLENIQPFVIVKKAQVDLGIKFLNLKHYGGKQLLAESVVEERDEYRVKMIELNKKKV